LGVTYYFICGNLSGFGNSISFNTVAEILNASMYIVKEKFEEINYITITNPYDINQPDIIDTKNLDFSGTISSNSITLSHCAGILFGIATGKPVTSFHVFDIPSDYKYARLKVEVLNLVEEDAEKTGAMIQAILLGPDVGPKKENQYAYVFTIGGIPKRDISREVIIQDKIYWETILYNQGGEEFAISVAGKALYHRFMDYKVHITIEKLSDSLDPVMDALSSVAPYLTAYRKGVIYAKPEFAFTADETIVPQLTSQQSGIAFPGANPELIDFSNQHTYKIHEELNYILANIAGIHEFSGDDDLQNLERLKDHYDANPINICLIGSAEMIPQYYYYDTPDAVSIRYGWDVASDFIYGNIDPCPRDDKIQNNLPSDKFRSKNTIGTPYDENYPYQENIVGRISGWDVQDVNALMLRIIFYDTLLDRMDDSWKNSAAVQTGSGTDVQRIWGIDFIRKYILGVHETELCLKWPTGQAHFENIAIKDTLQSICSFDEENVASTENHKSGRVPISVEVLRKMKRMGILNWIMFPKVFAQLTVGNERTVTGGQDQINSNFIYSFGHGMPLGYGHGDVQIDSIGIRPIFIHSFINRMLFATGVPMLGSGLSKVGSYDVRYLENMEFGPSVLFINSCVVGRIDGWFPECNAGQAYLHSGINALIAASRSSPGPGYLDVRVRPKGFGISEWIKTKQNPELQKLHFGGLFASDIFKNLGESDCSIGMAFRNARNSQMDDADSEFFWTPPLSLSIHTQDDFQMWEDSIRIGLDANGGLTKAMEKKFTCFMEFNLFSDPAFNPYEPRNEGRVTS
ncbi:MAG: C25 family cysteine peptidase, partial [Candidatus Thermoplasmatota archaeon]|nr:C25 family cysteine peptidase [Candidatus Thermoplasmatota archaeon]